MYAVMPPAMAIKTGSPQAAQLVGAGAWINAAGQTLHALTGPVGLHCLRPRPSYHTPASPRTAEPRDLASCQPGLRGPPSPACRFRLLLLDGAAHGRVLFLFTTRPRRNPQASRHVSLFHTYTPLRPDAHTSQQTTFGSRPTLFLKTAPRQKLRYHIQPGGTRAVWP